MMRGTNRSLCYMLLAVSSIAGCAENQEQSASAPAATTEIHITDQSTANRYTAADEKFATEEFSPTVRTFCGDCHAMPQPRSFSQQHWQREVQRGFDFYFASGRADLAVPRAADVTGYFSALAPQKLVLPAPQPLDAEARARYQSQQQLAPAELTEAVAGASVLNVDWGPAIGERLMFADMRSGAIVSSSFHKDRLSEGTVVARLHNPCRLVPGDLDGTGRTGLLVADLGSFLPADHGLGRVIWLRRAADNTHDGPEELRLDTEVILDGCGRVADVQPADLDGDGDTDLVVADFGWHATGRLLWLERITPGPATAASFITHILDERPGCLEVPIIDINADGHLDIIALIAQEFESIVAFLGDGAGGFGQPTTLFAAGDPAYGSSGMMFSDLDADGDADIIYTNGDSFDSFEAKPFHAVHWLENRGDLQFEPHELLALPGVHRASPGDVDGDGDLDIVAASFLPRDLTTAFPSGSPMAIVWLENDGRQNFRVRPLQVGTCLHPALCLTDFNKDGRLDVAAANFYEDAAEPRPAVDVLIAQ